MGKGAGLIIILFFRFSFLFPFIFLLVLKLKSMYAEILNLQSKRINVNELINLILVDSYIFRSVELRNLLKPDRSIP